MAIANQGMNGGGAIRIVGVFVQPDWCRLTEAEAKGIAVQVSKFPWAASGRALSFDHPEGLTKLIIDPDTERVLGVGIVGYGAGELISEGAVAIEMGATAKDIVLTVHPHPTLSECQRRRAFTATPPTPWSGKRPSSPTRSFSHPCPHNPLEVRQGFFHAPGDGVTRGKTVKGFAACARQPFGKIGLKGFGVVGCVGSEGPLCTVLHDGACRTENCKKWDKPVNTTPK
jgi:hypothetical protein